MGNVNEPNENRNEHQQNYENKPGNPYLQQPDSQVEYQNVQNNPLPLNALNMPNNVPQYSSSQPPYYQVQNNQQFDNQQQYSQYQNIPPQNQLPIIQPPVYQSSQMYQQPNFGPNYYQQPYMQIQQPQGGYGLAIASMVLGIISILIECVFWPISIIMSIIGLILGIISVKNNYNGKGMAIAGIVLSALVLVGLILFIVGCSACTATMFNGLSEYNDFYY